MQLQKYFKFEKVSDTFHIDFAFNIPKSYFYQSKVNVEPIFYLLKFEALLLLHQ